jgi:hypothetical protein
LSNLTDRLAPPARLLANWVQLAAIVTFAGAGLMLIAGVAAAVDIATDHPLLGVFLGLLNAASGLASLFLGAQLLRYAGRLMAMAASGEIQPLIEGAVHETSYWRVAAPLTVLWLGLQAIGTMQSAEERGVLLLQAAVALHRASSAQPMTGPMLLMYLLGGAFAIAGVIFAVQASKD